MCKSNHHTHSLIKHFKDKVNKRNSTVASHKCLRLKAAFHFSSSEKLLEYSYL